METERLFLVPYEQSFIEATLSGNETLAEISGYQVAEEWPGSEFFFYLTFALEEIRVNSELVKWTRLIVLKKENKIIGEVSAQGDPDQSGTAELGYGIVESYAGNGYATEGVKAFLKWLQEQKIRSIYAKTYKYHKKSQHILKKLGFVELGEDYLIGEEPVIEFEWIPDENQETMSS